MARHLVLAVAGLSLSLAGCHATTTSHALAEGVTAQAKPADSQVDVLDGRPSRPFRSLGTVEVRVDRGTALDDPTLADAILDRVVHSAHRIELKGESLRKRPAKP